jgi:oxygen-independent coproporphyrinogen-3 oxidase
VRTPERYIEAIEAGRSPEAGFEVLDGAQRELEALQLAVRTADGVPADALAANDIASLVAPTGGGERLVLTPRGRLLANEVAMRLTPPLQSASPVAAPVAGRRSRR